MEDRFGYGAIVRAMRPEEREEMLGLLLEAVAGEMPAGAEEEPPEACPRCGCPPAPSDTVNEKLPIYTNETYPIAPTPVGQRRQPTLPGFGYFCSSFLSTGTSLSL